MSKCIYCLKTESETPFKGEEHIIPQSLGGKPFPTITKEFICSNCNSVILSKLETGFKQDSSEGVFAQLLRIGGADSVWIRGSNININTVSGFGDAFFNEMFPFLKIENNFLVVDMVPQLKVRNKSSGFQIFPLSTLEKAKDATNKKKYNKIKERVSNASLKDLALFTGSKDGSTASIDSFIELLKEYGVNYQEKERKYTHTEEIQDKQFEIDWKCKIDNDLMRVIAKIAFNYFAYCSISEGTYYQDLLMGENFNEIRKFIIIGEGNWKDFVKFSDKKAILNIEGDGEKRILAHTILFANNNNGVIMARVSLFGGWIYEVKIGKHPLKLILNNFGCGHSFEPFSRTIHAISPIPNSINRLADRGYGWFKI